MRPIWAAGLMSGTSLDGVDAALVLSDGETIRGFGPRLSRAYDRAEAAVLAAALDWAAALWPARGGAAREPSHAAAEEVLHRTHLAAIRALGTRMPEPPELIGFHGQTVIHRPEAGYTLQLGDGARLAQESGVPVVADFRSADMAAGGEGAPLAPFFHFALARFIGATEPLAFLNLGGVGNVTWVDPRAADPAAPGALLAFDTGPANALVNDWMARHGGAPLDRDGRAAAAGRVHDDRLRSNAARAYLDRTPPKSLDRNDFLPVLAAMEGLSTEDGAATLTAFSAECAAAARAHLPTAPARWLVCGGGRHNPVLMAMLAARLGVPVVPVETEGLDGDMLEAQAFAWLAVRAQRGLPLSAPGTTGCAAPAGGGVLHRP